MKAKTVNENVNFERGQDPKRQMGLGTPNLDNLDYKWRFYTDEEVKALGKQSWLKQVIETTFRDQTFRTYGTYRLVIILENGLEGNIPLNTGRYYKLESVLEEVVDPAIREFMWQG